MPCLECRWLQKPGGYAKRGIVGADWGSNVSGAGIVVAGEGEKVGTDVRDAAGGRRDRLGAEDSEVLLGPAQMEGGST